MTVITPEGAPGPIIVTPGTPPPAVIVADQPYPRVVTLADGAPVPPGTPAGTLIVRYTS